MAPPARGSAAAWLQSAVDAAGALACHGDDARSFRGPWRPLAVCARCSGLYLGAVVGAWIAWRGQPRRLRRAAEGELALAARRVLLWSGILTAATVVLEIAGAWDPGNPGRAAAAVPLGAAVAWLAATVADRATAPVPDPRPAARAQRPRPVE
jgi:hypothetical protein